MRTIKGRCIDLGTKGLTDEQTRQMFENEYKLSGKYEKGSNKRIRKFLKSIGCPVPTTKDIYKKGDIK